MPRDQLLAQAIPAMTVAAGGPGGGRFSLDELLPKENVKDMQAKFKNGWPEERKVKGDLSWKHSDLRNVSYLYIFEIFKGMLNPAEM